MSPPDWNKQIIMLDKQTVPVTFANGTHYIFNQIAEPDTHSQCPAKITGHLCSTPQHPCL